MTVSKPSTIMIVLGKDDSDRITISFPYDPQLVAKVKTIDGRKWHKDKKYWSFPDSDSTLKQILKVFEGEEINIDPALKGTVPDLRTEQSGVVESGLSLKFEDLRRELISRKYSYRTVNPAPLSDIISFRLIAFRITILCICISTKKEFYWCRVKATSITTGISLIS